MRRMLRYVPPVLLLVLGTTASYAQSITANFTIGDPLFTSAPIPSIGSVTLTLNSDGTIGVNVLSTSGGIQAFAFNPANGNTNVTISGLPAGYLGYVETSPAQPVLLGDFGKFAAIANGLDARPEVTNLSFMVSTPGGFTSPSQLVALSQVGTLPNGSPSIQADFFLGTYDSTSRKLYRADADVASCQVGSFTSYAQYSAPALTDRYQALTSEPTSQAVPVPQYFGYVPSPNAPAGSVNPYVLCPTISYGCALSSTASMLTSFPSLTSINPAELDLRLGQGPLYGNNGTVSLCPLDLPNCSIAQPDERVVYPDWCEFPWQSLHTAYPEITLDYGRAAQNSQLYETGKGYVPVGQFLTDQVCGAQARVVLQLCDGFDSSLNCKGGSDHYVFVTGQTADGSDWNVSDPGWSHVTCYNHAQQNCLNTLSGHLGPSGGFTSGSGTFWQFAVGGAWAYTETPSTGKPGEFSVTAQSPVELLLIDPQGRELGSADGVDVFEIAEGNYMREFPLADDTGGGKALGDVTGTKVAIVEAPLNGVYQVTTTGTALGTYTLNFRTVSPDGSSQNGDVSGVTNVRSKTTYEIAYSSSPGLSGPIKLIATFESTLADIDNSQALGLINDSGVAQSLEEQINAAQVAASRDQTKVEKNILEAFEHLVSAQTAKHITGVAPQVLQADAQSLLSQTQP